MSDYIYTELVELPTTLSMRCHGAWYSGRVKGS